MNTGQGGMDLSLVFEIFQPHFSDANNGVQVLSL